MKKLSLFAAVVFSAAAVNAAELADISAGEVSASMIEVPAPLLQADAKCGYVSGDIAKNNLLASAAKSSLRASARNEAEFKEFVAFWTPILEKFGLRVTGTEHKYELGIINYESPDGTVVRTFLADEMNYDPLSAEAMKKERHMLIEALEKQHMTPVAAFMLKLEFLRPTFNVYYLTKGEANPDHETQLRQLKNGNDIDFDLLEKSVNLVEKDSSFSLVYIGKLLGFKTKVAADEAGIGVKIADYRKFLAENKKEFIASRTFKLEKPIEYGDNQAFNYAANIYFFQ